MTAQTHTTQAQHPNPFRLPGEWLRCALHTHTTESDGELSPSALVDHYERAGFDVISITDHWKITRASDNPAMITIPGVELNARQHDGRRLDVLAYNLSQLPEYTDSFPSLTDLAEYIAAGGGLGFLAHPYWSGAHMSEVMAAPQLIGIEVHNANCDLQTGRGESVVHWDELLDSGRPATAIACDDCHLAGFESAIAWTMARASARTPAAVIDSLRTGATYSTTGPELIDVTIDRNGTHVTSSPCQSITIRTGPQDGARVVAGRLGYRYNAEVVSRDASGLITEALLQPPDDAKRGRIEAHAPDGTVARSNQISLIRTSADGEH